MAREAVSESGRLANSLRTGKAGLIGGMRGHERPKRLPNGFL